MERIILFKARKNKINNRWGGDVPVCVGKPGCGFFFSSLVSKKKSVAGNKQEPVVINKSRKGWKNRGLTFAFTPSRSVFPPLAFLRIGGGPGSRGRPASENQSASQTEREQKGVHDNRWRGGFPAPALPLFPCLSPSLSIANLFPF